MIGLRDYIRYKDKKGNVKRMRVCSIVEEKGKVLKYGTIGPKQIWVDAQDAIKDNNISVEVKKKLDKECRC